MHNKEIPQFSNKLKVTITSGLRRFISSKEIDGYTFHMQSVYMNTGAFESR